MRDSRGARRSFQERAHTRRSAIVRRIPKYDSDQGAAHHARTPREDRLRGRVAHETSVRTALLAPVQREKARRRFVAGAPHVDRCVRGVQCGRRPEHRGAACITKRGRTAAAFPRAPAVAMAVRGWLRSQNGRRHEPCCHGHEERDDAFQLRGHHCAICTIHRYRSSPARRGRLRQLQRAHPSRMLGGALPWRGSNRSACARSGPLFDWGREPVASVG